MTKRPASLNLCNSIRQCYLGHMSKHISEMVLHNHLSVSRLLAAHEH